MRDIHQALHGETRLRQGSMSLADWSAVPRGTTHISEQAEATSSEECSPVNDSETIFFMEQPGKFVLKLVESQNKDSTTEYSRHVHVFASHHTVDRRESS